MVQARTSRESGAKQKDVADAYRRRIDQVGAQSRRALTRHLRKIEDRRSKGLPFSRLVEKLERELAFAEAQCARKDRAIPEIHFPDELPISQSWEQIAEAIERHPVVVVCGETGSGKSTQLPKICLKIGRGRRAKIGHTQPRRIAARSVAERIATELGQTLGGTIGYRVRFDEKTGPDTAVKVLTDGMLLAEIESDRQLLQYDTLIIDEAHERSLNIDFLLGYLKRLVARRPEFKAIVTSATLEIEKFTRHFDNAPVLEVSGRSYPVEIRYRPVAEDGDDDDPENKALLDAIQEVSALGRGDVLVFLPGEREIRDAEQYLTARLDGAVEVVPLYARLSPTDQRRIFRPHRGRRVILATNVAETSLTVPGIHYVIDTGVARVSRYSPGRKVQRLPIERISRASADQRAGRCGRVAPGVCVRLFDEPSYESRPEHTDPEILRTSLAAVVLRMKAMHLGDIRDFPFVDPPASKQITAGHRLLQELGALDARRQMTEIGWRLARLPVDPRIGRMLLAASELGCLREVIVIAAALEISDPRVVPHEKKHIARDHHRTFPEAGSDFEALLALWDIYWEQSRSLSKRQLRRFCQTNFLSPSRMREWADLQRQLRRTAQEGGYSFNDEPATSEILHQALLTGLIGNVAMRTENGSYQGTHGKTLAISSASRLARSKAKWIVCAEMTETERLYARHVATIKPQWVESVARHQLHYSYSDPQWSSRQGRVLAIEKATLGGLTVVSGRRVDYSRINPTESRAIFIRDGLVFGSLRSQCKFWRHNEAVLEEVRSQEHKLRERDEPTEGDRLVSFYEANLPHDICTLPALEKWYRHAVKENPETLLLHREDVTPRAAFADEEEGFFPDEIDAGGTKLPLVYRHAPAEEDDGVTAKIPAFGLNQLSVAQCDRLVPGYLAEKITALLRTLPKSARRQIVPLPDTVKTLLPEIEGSNRPLLEALAESLNQRRGVSIQPTDFRQDALPAYLRLRLLVTDRTGKELASGRDVAALKEKYSEAAKTEFGQQFGVRPERSGARKWEFDTIPVSVDLQVGSVETTAFPALVDEGESVGVRLFSSKEEAREAHRLGLHRLLLIESPDQRRYLSKLRGTDRLCLQFASIAPCDVLREDIQRTVLDRAIDQDPYEVRNQNTYDAIRDQFRKRSGQIATDLVLVLEKILDQWRASKKALAQHRERLEDSILSDVEQQLTGLVYAGFVSQTPSEWLNHIPRYLKGIESRLEKAVLSPDADRARGVRLAPLLRRLDDVTPDQRAPEWLAYRWMIEEFRVSIFAQHLKTAFPVSERRLDDQWQRFKQRGSDQA